MHRFRAATNRRFLYLYEIPDDGSFFHPRIHSQVREWSDCAIIGDLRINDEAMVFHRYSVAEFRIDNARTLLNLASFANDGYTLYVNTGMDDRIATDLCPAAYVRVGRIEKGHAVFHHQAPNRAASKQVFEFSQFSSCVDSGNFAGIRMQVEAYSPAIAFEERRRVGKVIFALTIVGLYLFERVE